MAAPRSYNMADWKAAATGDCIVICIGDSQMTATATPRLYGGAIRSWDVNFAGLFVSHNGNSYEGQGISANVTGITNNTILPASTFTDTTTNSYPQACREMLFAANKAAGNLILSHRLDSLSSYIHGDWAINNKLRGTVIYRRKSTGVTSLDMGGTRNGSAFPIVTTEDFSGTDTFQTKVAEFGNPDGVTSTLPRVDLYSNSSGVDETGMALYIFGVWMNAYEATGLRLASIAQGGWKTTDHSASGTYSDTALQHFLTAIGVPTATNVLFLVQLGQNPATGETTNAATYRTNLEAVLSRYRSAVSTVGGPAPLFCLRCNWETNAQSAAYYQMMADQQHAIAQSASDVGTVNLYKAVNDDHGAYATWSGTYLSDGVHQTQAGTVEFESIFWDEVLVGDPGTSPTSPAMVFSAFGWGWF